MLLRMWMAYCTCCLLDSTLLPFGFLLKSGYTKHAAILESYRTLTKFWHPASLTHAIIIHQVTYCQPKFLQSLLNVH